MTRPARLRPRAFYLPIFRHSQQRVKTAPNGPGTWLPSLLRQRQGREGRCFQQWTLKQSDDPVFKAYRREYKRRFAWIKAGRISDSQFYAWSEQAREQKKKCDRDIITLEEFQQWLKES